MTLSEEVDQANREFQKAGSTVAMENALVRVTGADKKKTHTFKVPDDEGRGRLPAWFWAGIWDFFQMKDLHETFDMQMLEGGGWGFYQNGSRYWVKSLSEEAGELVYDRFDNRLLFNRLLLRSPALGVKDSEVVRRKSIYHLAQWFEENGWFEPLEPKIDTQAIANYLVK